MKLFPLSVRTTTFTTKTIIMTTNYLNYHKLLIEAFLLNAIRNNSPSPARAGSPPGENNCLQGEVEIRKPTNQETANSALASRTKTIQNHRNFLQN